MRKTALPIALIPLLLAASCGRKTSSSRKGPLVDSAGAAMEVARSDFQFRLARSGSTPSEADSGREVQGSLEADARRYRDTLAVSGGRAADRAGTVDWKATWLDGRFDRPALALALVRTLVDSSCSLVEWSLPDTAGDTLGLRVVFQRPGPYGGPMDSALFSVLPDGMRRR